MHKILKQSGKKPVLQKTKKIRIAEKTQLLSAKLGKELNTIKEDMQYDPNRT